MRLFLPRLVFYSSSAISFAEMRIPGLILSFYLILLATVPCCAVDNCPEDKTEHAAEHKKGDDPASPAGRDCGSCSPFFSCEGCATVFISYPPVQIEIVSLKEPAVYAVYIQTALPDFNYDFWQPPKLG